MSANNRNIGDGLIDMLATYLNASECDLGDERDVAETLWVAGFRLYASHADLYQSFTLPAIERARALRQKALTLVTLA